MTVVRVALIQSSWTGDKESMITKNVGLAREVAGQGTQILCFQELFYGPYFCVEQVPDGPTIRLMRDLANGYYVATITGWASSLSAMTNSMAPRTSSIPWAVGGRTSVGRPRRTSDPRSRHGRDWPSAQTVGVLPRPPTGYLRGVGGYLRLQYRQKH